MFCKFTAEINDVTFIIIKRLIFFLLFVGTLFLTCGTQMCNGQLDPLSYLDFIDILLLLKFKKIMYFKHLISNVEKYRFFFCKFGMLFYIVSKYFTSITNYYFQL